MFHIRLIIFIFKSFFLYRVILVVYDLKMSIFLEILLFVLKSMST